MSMVKKRTVAGQDLIVIYFLEEYGSGTKLSMGLLNVIRFGPFLNPH